MASRRLGVLGIPGQPDSGKDTDGDGRTDAAEQNEGTNPTDPRSRLALEIHALDADGAAILGLTVAPGFHYRLQSSGNLADWQLNGSALEATETPVSLRIPAALWGETGTNRFFRVFSQ